ncbi:hypothetical protein QYM36_018835 [Artemia franciscana]|uniref:Ig-like domain-containing protein n=1 Tax=Artemia franciscana TaxID=6661 RepID=A0AA88L009_ARTSF|nr:hypothetical protein QYM36_018835 [Artemia franciscana]
MSGEANVYSTALPVPLLTVLDTYNDAIKQSFRVKPNQTVVNPGETAVMDCKILNKGNWSNCAWQKDRRLIGIYPGTYEWSGDPEQGDCSLKILSTHVDLDDGLWECQVTASNFDSVDSLNSEPARLAVRAEFYAFSFHTSWHCQSHIPVSRIKEFSSSPFDIKVIYTSSLERVGDAISIYSNLLRTGASNLTVIGMIFRISKQNKPHVTSYLLRCSPNKLIAMVGTELVQRVVEEVNEAHFFGGFADKTPAVTQKERLAVGVPYTDVKGATKEHLLTVVDCESKKGVDLSKEILHVMRKLGIN